MGFRIKIKTDEIARARVLAGYSIRGASQALGKTSTHISNIEAGRGQPSPSLLKQMAELYGVEMASLFIEVDKADVA